MDFIEPKCLNWEDLPDGKFHLSPSLADVPWIWHINDFMATNLAVPSTRQLI
jgi:hypothetical protein